MKIIIQRVECAKVTVDNKTVGQIKAGLAVLVAFKKGDDKTQVDKMAHKLLNLRVMADDSGKMNLSVIDTRAELLIISQFTLYADTSQRRPGFTKAAAPDDARELFDYFISELKKSKLTVETGQFGAYMHIELHNDGPVTIVLEL